MPYFLPNAYYVDPAMIHLIQLANLRLDEILIGFGFPPVIPMRLTYQKQFCNNCSARCTNNKDTCCPSCKKTPGKHHPKFPCSGKVRVQTCLNCDKPAAHRYHGVKYKHCCKGCATNGTCTCGRIIVDPRTGLRRPVRGSNPRYEPPGIIVIDPFTGGRVYMGEQSQPMPMRMIFK